MSGECYLCPSVTAKAANLQLRLFRSMIQNPLRNHRDFSRTYCHELCPGVFPSLFHEDELWGNGSCRTIVHGDEPPSGSDREHVAKPPGAMRIKSHSGCLGQHHLASDNATFRATPIIGQLNKYRLHLVTGNDKRIRFTRRGKSQGTHHQRQGQDQFRQEITLHILSSIGPRCWQRLFEQYECSRRQVYPSMC